MSNDHNRTGGNDINNVNIRVHLDEHYFDIHSGVIDTSGTYDDPRCNDDSCKRQHLNLLTDDVYDRLVDIAAVNVHISSADRATAAALWAAGYHGTWRDNHVHWAIPQHPDNGK